MTEIRGIFSADEIRDFLDQLSLSFAKIHASFRRMHHGSIPVAFHCSQTSHADDLRFDCTRQCDQEVIATTMSSFLNSVGVRLSFTQRVASNDDAGHRLEESP